MMLNRRRGKVTHFWFFFLVLLTAGAAVHGQEIETLQTNFRREVVYPDRTETLSGKIYYSAPDYLLFEFITPQHQIMVFRGQGVTIYYPEEKKGFRLFSRQRQMASLPETFLGMLKDDFGLAEAGFTLTSNLQDDDSLRTYWLPPKSIRGNISRITQISREGLPRVLEAFDPKMNTVFKIEYGGFIQAGGHFLPTEVSTMQYIENKKVIQHIQYSEHIVNRELPDRYLPFVPPDDADMEDMQW